MRMDSAALLLPLKGLCLQTAKEVEVRQWIVLHVVALGPPKLLFPLVMNLPPCFQHPIVRWGSGLSVEDVSHLHPRQAWGAQVPMMWMLCVAVEVGKEVAALELEELALAAECGLPSLVI